MARTVIWTETATRDLEFTVQYIARDSKFYAAVFAKEVLRAASSLAELSERGRNVPELDDPSIREIFVRKYRLIYFVGQDRVDILTLVYGGIPLTPVND